MKVTITLKDVRAALDAVGVVGISFSGGDLTDYDLLRSDLREDFSFDSLDTTSLLEHIEKRTGVVISAEGKDWFSVHTQSVENFLKMVNDYQK